MRKLLTAVPALLLLAAVPTPGLAQMDQPRAARQAETDRDTGARDVVPSRDLIGKRVVHRHGGPVAGTIRDVATGPDGQPAITMQVANTDRTLTFGPSDFERRGNGIVLMHDRDEVAQLLQYDREATTGYGSSGYGNPMGGVTGGAATPGTGQ